MPKPSGAPDKFASGGGGKFTVEAGNYEVAKAAFLNHEIADKAGKVIRANELALALAIWSCDAQWNRAADQTEPKEIHLGLGSKSLENGLHPGIGVSADDDNPADQGTKPGTAGNTVYITEPGIEIHAATGYAVFARSLVALGFPNATLHRLWAPDYEGLRITLATMTGAEANKLLKLQGRDSLNEKPTKDGGTVTYKLATAWGNPGYLDTQKLPVGAVGSQQAINGRANVMTIDEMTRNVLTSIAKEKAGKKIVSLTSLQAFVRNHWASKLRYPPAQVSEAVKLVTPEYLRDWALELGITDAGEPTTSFASDGSITFPA